MIGLGVKSPEISKLSFSSSPCCNGFRKSKLAVVIACWSPPGGSVVLQIKESMLQSRVAAVSPSALFAGLAKNVEKE